MKELIKKLNYILVFVKNCNIFKLLSGRFNKYIFLLLFGFDLEVVD